MRYTYTKSLPARGILYSKGVVINVIRGNTNVCKY